MIHTLKKWIKKPDVILPIFGATVCALLQLHNGMRFFDDAYITFRYARNISLGQGFVYNLGERVLGTTTPLFTLILAGIAWIFSPRVITNASFYITLVSDVINVFLIFRICYSLFQDKILSFAIMSAFILNPLRLDVASGGMETSLFICLMLLTYATYLCHNKSTMTAVWASFSFLIRPDAIFFIFPLFLDWFIHDHFKAIKASILTILISTPWIIFAWVYFGNPIPNSILAKSISYGNLTPGHAAYFLFTFFSTWTLGIYNNILYLFPGLTINIFLSIIACLHIWKNHIRTWVIVVYPILYYAIMLSLNSPMSFAWYYPPLLPGLLILVISGFYFLISRLKLRTVFLFVFILLNILVPTWLMDLYPSFPILRNRESKFLDACQTIYPQVSTDDVILTPDIGVLGWCLEHSYILDSVGLVTPQSLPFIDTQTNQGIISQELVKQLHPDYVISLDQFLIRIVADESFHENYLRIWQIPLDPLADPTQYLNIYMRYNKAQ